MALYEINPNAMRGSGTYYMGRAGEALGRCTLVYKHANGAWYLADADAVATMPVIGLSMEKVIAGQVVRILKDGYIGRTTWTWTVGGNLYASTVAGEITQVPPAGVDDTIQQVGMATRPNIILFSPQGGGGGTGCSVLEGATAYVGFDECKEPYANYFLCDGVADDVQIQAALDYVGGLGGGSVMLERGTFSTSDMITISFSNTSLIGNNDTLIIAAARGGESYLVDIADGVENIDISQIEFQADLVDPDAYDSVITGEGTTENIKIHHCRFIAKIYSGKPTPEDLNDSSFVRAISVSETGLNWKIYKNLVVGAAIEAISVSNRPNETDNDGPMYCEVSSNLVRNCRLGVAIEKGAKYNLCENNIIHDTDGNYVILVRHEGTTDNEVVDNIIINNTGIGIEFDATHRNYVADNFIYNVSSGIGLFNEASFNTIKNNEIYKLSAAGVYFHVDCGEYNDVYGNTIKYCGTDGISIENRQKRVEANHVEYCQGHGVRLVAGTEGTHILHNVFGNVDNRGIYLNHTSTGVETRVEGNTIFDDQDDDTTTIVGAHAAGVSDITVVDATSFEIGQAIQTQPTGFGNEDHYISEINYVENIITIEGVLANNHINTDPLIGRTTTLIGIDEETTTDYNIIRNNRFYDIATFVVIEGTHTILETKTFPFIAGGDVDGTALWASFVSATASAKGWSVTGAADWAQALCQLPQELQQVVRIKIWAVALGAPIGAGGQMHLEINMNAGASNLAYTTENVALANFDGEEVDYVNTDVVHWVVDSGDDADVGHMTAGMSLEVEVIYETGADPDGATNAVFRTVEVEYV